MKLIKHFISPLPLKVSLQNDINILQSVNFFYNLFLIITIILAIRIIFKYHKKLFYIFSPYLFYMIVMSNVHPGNNRIRDVFTPILCLYSTIAIQSIINYKKRLYIKN